MTKDPAGTGHDGRERVWTLPVTRVTARDPRPGVGPACAGAGGEASAGGEAGDGSGCGSRSVAVEPGREPGRAAAVPLDVKAFAEEFVRAAHQNTMQGQWPKMRGGVLGMQPQNARALFFCATRTGKGAGRSYWERVFACDLVDARTVLDVLRAFDGHGVPIFATLEQDVRITELAEQRARREATFGLVSSWLRAAKSPARAPGPAGSRQVGAGNTAFPLAAPARTATEPDAEARARHAAGPAGACLVCGRTPAELHAPGRTQPRGPVSEPLGPISEPRGPISEPLGPVSEPRGPRSEAGGAGSGALLRCGRCGRAHYCSAVCQRWHWGRVHRAECSGSDAQ